ncbi:MAG: PDZ domain-containing protein [Bacillota bacterium]
MNPLLELLTSVVKSYPSMFASPIVAVLYLVVLGLVAAQYGRVQLMEERAFGRPLNRALGHTLVSIGLGLLGGLAASILLVMIGVTVSDSGVGYLLPIALFMFLWSPRFLCFSYAGGLLSLSYLMFGWPRVNVAAITALVACLHAAESLLIRMSGESCSTPVYIEGKEDRTVGGFSLQRFWPTPIIVLALMRVPDVSALGGVINLPDWWPLIKAPEIAGVGTPVFTMLPVVAALGYGDLALSRTPREKARVTSRNLFFYSAILLGFSIAASRWPAFTWVAALFAPLGHEAVIYAGNSDERERDPRFVSSAAGLTVMDVFDNSPAAEAGLGQGWVLSTAQGLPLRSRHDLDEILKEPGDVSFSVRPPRSTVPRQVQLRRQGTEPLGLVLAPGLGDRPFVFTHSAGPLLRLLKGWFGRRR